MSGKLRNRQNEVATSFQTAGDHRSALRATVSYLLLEQRMVFDGAAHDTAHAAADPSAPVAPPGVAHAPAGGPAPATDNLAGPDHAAAPATQDHSAPAPAPALDMPETIKLFGDQHAVDHASSSSIVFIDASVRDASTASRLPIPRRSPATIPYKPQKTRRQR